MGEGPDGGDGGGGAVGVVEVDGVVVLAVGEGEGFVDGGVAEGGDVGGVGGGDADGGFGEMGFGGGVGGVDVLLRPGEALGAELVVAESAQEFGQADVGFFGGFPGLGVLADNVYAFPPFVCDDSLFCCLQGVRVLVDRVHVDLPPCLLAGFEAVEQQPSTPAPHIVDYYLLVFRESIQSIDQGYLVLIVLRVVQLKYRISIRPEVVGVGLQRVLKEIVLTQSEMASFVLFLELADHELYELEVVGEIGGFEVFEGYPGFMVEEFANELFVFVDEDRESFVVGCEDGGGEDDVVYSFREPAVNFFVAWEVPCDFEHQIIVHLLVDVLADVDVVLPGCISFLLRELHREHDVYHSEHPPVDYLVEFPDEIREHLGGREVEDNGRESEVHGVSDDELEGFSHFVVGEVDDFVDLEGDSFHVGGVGEILLAGDGGEIEVVGGGEDLGVGEEGEDGPVEVGGGEFLHFGAEVEGGEGLPVADVDGPGQGVGLENHC